MPRRPRLICAEKPWKLEDMTDGPNSASFTLKSNSGTCCPHRRFRTLVTRGARHEKLGLRTNGRIDPVQCPLSMGPATVGAVDQN